MVCTAQIDLQKALQSTEGIKECKSFNIVIITSLPLPVCSSCDGKGTDTCNGRGLCSCKSNIIGEECNDCKSGYFDYPRCNKGK